jgi:xylulokinase
MTQWFVREFVPVEEQERFYSEAQEQVSRLGSAPTGICVLPHLIGACTPAWDPSATGVIVGLTPETSRWHLCKALFEGFACELDLNIEAVERAVSAVRTVRIFGGNSRHPFSLRLRADITGKRFEALTHPEAVCLGAAILAGIAAGRFPNADAASAMIGQVESCEPNPTASRAYEVQKRQYRAIYPALNVVRAMKGESL